MKLKGKLSILIIFVISIFTFYGCAEVEFIRAIDSNNIIVDKLVVSLDETKIRKSGKTLQEVRDAIESDMVVFRTSIDEWKNQFEDINEISLALKDGIRSEVAVNSFKLSIAVEFANIDVFKLFYGYSDIDNFEYKKAFDDVGPFVKSIIESEYQTDLAGLFFYKYSMISNKGIIDNLSGVEINGENVESKYKNLMNNWYSSNDISFSQIFVFPDDRIYSNADFKEVEKGLTFLKWDFGDKPANFEMVIYKIAPKTMIWYVLALIISIAVIVTLVFYIRKKSKNDIVVRITKEDVEKVEK